MKRFNVLLMFSVLLAFVIGCFRPDNALSQALYFRDKTITIVRGGGAGGLGEWQIRALVPYLHKYIPGNPTIVVQFMPGAGGRKMANHLFHRARPDGLTIGASGGGLVAAPVLDLPGVEYDLERLIYLGSTQAGSPDVFFTRREVGLDTLEKLRAASGLRIGAQSVGHPVYYGARLVAYLLDLKNPQFVTGYGAQELDIALMRGEIDARQFATERRLPEYFEGGAVNFHVIITLPKGNRPPRFADLPDLDSFAKSEKERGLVNLFRALLYPRWPFFLPPSTPKEPAQILRNAFRKAFQDPEFIKEYEKLTGGEPSPLDGEEVETSIRQLPRGPETVSLFRRLAGAEPLPSR